MAGIAIGALRRPKPLALSTLAGISFIAPLAERWATGRVDPFSSYGLAEMALSLVVLFWWYHVDKAEHAYQAGKLMNAGVLLVAVGAPVSAGCIHPSTFTSSSATPTAAARPSASSALPARFTFSASSA